MKMKTKIILFAAAAIFSLNSIAQSSVEELKLILGDAKVAQLEAENQDYLSLLQFRNERGYYISNTGGKSIDPSYLDALDVLPINDNFPALTFESLQAGIPMLAYRFEIPSAGIRYYRIGDTDKLVGVYSDTKLRMLKERSE